MGPKLRQAFQNIGGHTFSDSHWLQHIHKGSNKTKLQYCKNSQDRAIQRHTGNVIALELMGHVAIPSNWKESCFIEDALIMSLQSSNQDSSIAGGRESEEGRQTIFFPPFNTLGDNPDEEEPSDDLSKPRKVHYHSKWNNTQDAVYWISSARAQEKGLQFWQTRSRAVIVHSSVPADCIYKVISQKG